LLKGSSILWRFLDSSFLENSAAGLLLDNEVLALYESQELRKSVPLSIHLL
jgi:hypothetical protein